MNFRGYAAYIDYLTKLEKNCCAVDMNDEEDDSSNYYSSNNSEEENNSSNSFEVLEKLDMQTKYNFQFADFDSSKQAHEFYLLDLYSLLKPGLNTPPPEQV